MKISQEKIIYVVSLAGYFIFAYVAIELFPLNKYGWMLGPGESLCYLPQDQDDIKGIVAPFVLLFLAAPLLIALIRDLLLKARFQVFLYGVGLVGVTLYWWWIFWGQYGQCG